MSDLYGSPFSRHSTATRPFRSDLYAGRSKSELAAPLGVDRKTTTKYLAPAIASGITPAGRHGGGRLVRADQELVPAVGGLFEAVEAQTLQPLPKTPFVLATWSTATV
ncbi:hypothetical protein ACWC4A_24770 [Streptomyces mirabilis]